MPPILIDFLIPQFDDERILFAIRSIIKHRDADRFRIIVQDGGLNQKLQKVIKQQLRPHDIHVIEQDRGIFDAINKASKKIHAPWVGWIGADDLLHDGFDIRPLINSSKNIHFIAYTTVMFNKNGAIHRVFRSPGMRRLRLIGLHLPHFSTFVRRTVFDEHLFELKYQQYADIPFFIELEQRYSGITVPLVSTLMAIGGASNSDVKQVIFTNYELSKAIAARQGWAYSIVFCSLKILFKVIQRIIAIIFYRDVVVCDMKLRQRVSRGVG